MKDSATDCKQFSRVFLPELQAVQTRRRRYRIERLLGFLPTVPERLPEVPLVPLSEEQVRAEVAKEEAAPAVLPETLATLENHRKRTDACRRDLENRRHPQGPRRERAAVGSAETPKVKPLSPEQERQGRRESAKKLLEAAKAWCNAAERHRDACFQAVLRHAKQPAPLDAKAAESAWPAWERAENIFTVAASA